MKITAAYFKTLIWWICALLTCLVLGLYAYHYTDILLTGDAAYNHMQAKEVLSLRHLDLVHIGYQYCGLTDHFIPGILSYFLPYGLSAIAGILVFFGAGYFCIRNEFQPSLRPMILLLLVLPFPCLFIQTYSAQGGHTYVIFQFFLGIWILSRSYFKDKHGSYNVLTYAVAGLSYGFALYAFLLSQLAGICLFACLFFLDLVLLVREKPLKYLAALPLKIGAAWIGYKFGNFPYAYSLHRFPDAHTFNTPNQMNFSSSHALETLPNLWEALSHLFMPNFAHGLILEGFYNHFSFPLQEVLAHYSWIGVAICSGFLVCFLLLTLRALWRSRMKNPFILYLSLNFAAFTAAYLLRAETITAIHGTRHLMVVYFVLILGVIRLMKPRYGLILASLIVILSLGSHFEILRANGDYLAKLNEDSSCTSLTRGQVQTLLREIQPPAMAGPYMTIWPLALASYNNLVLDVEKRKFYFHLDEFSRLPMTMFFYHSDSKAQILERIKAGFPRMPGADQNRSFIETELGFYTAYFEIMNPIAWKEFLKKRSLPEVSGWPELIDQKVAAFGKVPCAKMAPTVW
ncbi:hypothetical protein WDW86_00730 [Bdellovibrionota bacterium FG-2]